MQDVLVYLVVLVVLFGLLAWLARSGGAAIMVVGHYATALIAKERDPGTPLWFFLIAAISLDLLLVVLAVGGVERMIANPQPGLASLQTMDIDMRYSHDLLPVVGWAVVFGGVAFVWLRRWMAAFWAFALVLVHEASDLLAGFAHNVAGPESLQIGLKLYESAPLAAVGIELLLALVCVWWYTRRVKLTRWRQAGLYGVILLGIVAVLPSALVL